MVSCGVLKRPERDGGRVTVSSKVRFYYVIHMLLNGRVFIGMTHKMCIHKIVYTWNEMPTSMLKDNVIMIIESVDSVQVGMHCLVSFYVI